MPVLIISISFVFTEYPDFDGSIYDCHLSSKNAIQVLDRKSFFMFVGNFNAHEKVKSDYASVLLTITVLQYLISQICPAVHKYTTHQRANMYARELSGPAAY